MTNDYMFWDRIAGEFKDAVDKAKAELVVNSFILQCVEKERGKHSKPQDNSTEAK